MKSVVRKKSTIHGLGMFAAKDFEEGEVVIKWKSHKIISLTKLKQMSEKQKQNISYIKGKYVLVPPEGRINHSCDPNTVLSKFRYIATRDINKNEEITCDYTMESDSNFEMKCGCGSKRCLRVIRK